MSAVQGSAEWLAERAGHATASRACDILAKIKTGEAMSRRKYRLQIVTERLTGIPVSGYKNAAMQWGNDTEPYARAAYEIKTGTACQEAGFIKHPSIEWVGMSPDGLIDDDGLLEIKCPESTTHLDWLEQRRAPPEHVPQMQFQMWVSGRQWVDFVSFDPRFPSHLQLFSHRVNRDNAFIKEIEIEVIQFLAEVTITMDRLSQEAA